PLVFNITDGFPTDVDDILEIVEISEKIKNLQTTDGNVLLFNCLLKQNDAELEIVNLPSENFVFSDNEYYQALFDSSSYLPPKLEQEARRFFLKRETSNSYTKSVSITADANCIIQILGIGSNFISNNAEERNIFQLA